MIVSEKAGVSKSMHVYGRIKEMIVSGELHPGEELTEIDLSSRFQASRTPIRNALVKLSADGLVEMTPNKGCRVTAVTYDFAFQVLDARTALETHAIRMCCRRKDPKVIETLYLLIKEQQELLETGDTDAFIRADMQFHRFLVESGGNPLWMSFWETVMVHIQRIMSSCLTKTEIRESAVTVHRHLVHCVVRGDEKEATESLAAHFDDLRIDLLNTITDSK